MANNTEYTWTFSIFPIDEDCHYEYEIVRTCSVCKSEIIYNSDVDRKDQFRFGHLDATELAREFIQNMKDEPKTFTDEYFGTCDCREDK